MSVVIENEVDAVFDFDYKELIEKVTEACLDYVDCPFEVMLEVTLTDNEEIHRINQEFRKIDRPTDVLSFPMIEYERPGDFTFLESEDYTEVTAGYFDLDSGELTLGDIVISVDKVREQAKEYGHSEQRELAFLVAHSMFHLFGYDHMEEEERKEMEKMQLQSVSSRLGKKTIELEHLSKSIDGKQLLRDFSYKLPRDARIGVVGRNGAGKSTLIKLICGDLLPDSGNVVLGDTVRIGYFSQECEKMDPSQRVIDYIKETAERIQTPDGTVTAATMLERFLFTPELQWNHIEKLSGGERKRLYLLKVLMTAPNVLLLDEPTNDLDIATLTILEDYLQSFSGAIIAISHDRYFLDKMASEIWELSGDGCVQRYNGNYSDYAEKEVSVSDAAEKPKKAAEKKERVFVGEKKLKFSYKEQREYDTIDDDIAALEQQIEDTETEIGKSTSDYVKLQELSDRKTALEQQLEEKMERWLYLNDLAERIAASR